MLSSKRYFQFVRQETEDKEGVILDDIFTNKYII